MTLAEIMVCIAVVAIVAAMVVSFAQLMAQRTETSKKQLELQQDIQLVQTITENWLEQMCAAGAEFSLSADGKTITATVAVDADNEASYSLSFAYGRLIGKLPDDKSMNISTGQIDQIRFDAEFVMAGDVQKDHLFFVTMVSGDEEITFALNPRIGETLGGT